MPRAGFTCFVILDYLCYKPRSWHPPPKNYRLKGITDKGPLVLRTSLDPIQTEDILIAATAMIKGLTVVSNDSDFLRVEGLSLEDWTE